MAGESGTDAYREFVNPQWSRMLDILGMNVRYTRCEGAWLHTDNGRRILDFLSGYCVHNLGHNHPALVAALQDELAGCGPAMVQSHVPELAGLLAERLCRRAGSKLSKVFFCSSGSEGVEAAIKFARAHTGRNGLLYAHGAFHGLTCGALSLMDGGFWKDGFGPFLAGTEAVDFGDIRQLEYKLAALRPAAFIVEPIQSEAGVQIPDATYLSAARTLCHKHGALLVFDEVQTGLCRTGKFLAAHHYGVDPDMVILAKALSGGLVPSGAVLMTDDVYSSTYDSVQRAIVHTSTFSENGLAMRAGLATLDVLENENLDRRAAQLGEYLMRQLRDALDGFEMVREVRGVGLLNGIEFMPPPNSMRLRAAFEAFRAIHPGLFGQMLVMRLFREKNILTQICGNNFMVLKAAPPLVVSEEEIDLYVRSVRDVVEQVHSSSAFWSEALSLARKALVRR